MKKDKLIVKIDSLGSHGEGVGHLEDGYTLFIDGALPGEIVEASYIQQKQRYAEAQLLAVTKSSPHRVKPVCDLFGRCGGCQLMHLSYKEQLNVKRQRVIDAMQRIGKINDVNVPPCIPSPTPLAYRNKIQLPAKPGKHDLLLGLYAKSSHTLVDVESCAIHCSLGDEIYRKVKVLIQKSNLKAYQPKTDQGLLRHLLIKSAVHTEQALVIFVCNSEKNDVTLPLAEEIMAHCPAVKGVLQNINPKRDNTILGKRYQLLLGSGSIQEKLGSLLFNVSPASFFQVNPSQAVLLYQQALQFADLAGHEIVLDAYCGVGTLSLFFAKLAKHVIGVECIGEAIMDAKRNAELNGIKNVSFVCAKSETYIASLTAIDLAILNPPRKGCDPLFLKQLKRLRPKKIVYISCDPSTLARDIYILRDYGYTLNAIQPFDMFPQTAHVECVASLTSS